MMLHKNIDRRYFLKIGVGAFGTGFAYRSCSFLDCSSITGVTKREVLVCSDVHIGYKSDGFDGEEWFSRALSDIDSLGNVDYALLLGDIVHHGKHEEFEKYLFHRKNNSITKWYELAGNHEYGSDEISNYKKLIRPDKAYMILDGNLAWFLLSDEESSAKGNIGPDTYIWLRDMISQHQDRIIIVCSHQCVYGTVRDSKFPIRYIYPKKKIEEILNNQRIDLWLNGHQHMYPHSNEDIFTDGRTTFVNVASMSHAYGTKSSESFILEIKHGAKEIVAYRRKHDNRMFDNDYSVHIPVPFPIKISNSNKEKIHSSLSF